MRNKNDMHELYKIYKKMDDVWGILSDLVIDGYIITGNTNGEDDILKPQIDNMGYALADLAEYYNYNTMQKEVHK